MDFENTLSNTEPADTTDTPGTGETTAPVIVMQNDSATASVRSVTLDTPTLEAAGLPCRGALRIR